MALSERTTVVVEFPIEHEPSQEEYRSLMKRAFPEARKIIGPGRVLGIIEMARATRNSDGAEVVTVRVAVECPISVQLAAMN